jgi:hypothetical protein
MRTLVEELCSDRCAGRAPGTEGGRAARGVVIDALRDAGLDPQLQAIPRCGGANVLATIPGAIDRWVLVAAHYDHLGTNGQNVFRGADDNAAAVAILVTVARALAVARPRGRGVIIAAFDAEEPPNFLTASMGSEHFARHPLVPLDRIDLMICMDLVGHALGEDPLLPIEVRRTVFALGAERSAGTLESLLAIAEAEPGVYIRPADAEIVPPLSDYAAFWDRDRPFVFLTNGRSRRYHTYEDTPEHLDYAKMAATARWLERFVRQTCQRDERPLELEDRSDHVSTLDSLDALLTPLAARAPAAGLALEVTKSLRAACRADRSLPEPRRPELAMLVARIESALA